MSYEDAVIQGGGEYVGIQECEGMDNLVLFNSPQTGSTLALMTRQISPERVRERIKASDATFRAAGL